MASNTVKRRKRDRKKVSKTGQNRKRAIRAAVRKAQAEKVDVL